MKKKKIPGLFKDLATVHIRRNSQEAMYISQGKSDTYISKSEVTRNTLQNCSTLHVSSIFIHVACNGKFTLTFYFQSGMLHVVSAF